MFQNPMPKPSCQKFRKPIITQKVFVTQSSNIVHCDQHTKKLICADIQAFLKTISLYKLTFFHFLSRGVQQTALAVEMWNCNSWPLDACGGLDLPGDLPIWALTVGMWNCHSQPLDAFTGGVDLPLDLPIWALTLEASWSANMSSNSWNHILPFLMTRCHYIGVDLPVDLPIWALTV